MKKELKSKWVNAFEITLSEYINENHILSDCKLCDLAQRYCCHNCPMNVFGNSNGCLERRILPVSCRYENMSTSKILAEFYKGAIKILKESPLREREYNIKTDSVWSRKIKEHDKEIAKKYKL